MMAMIIWFILLFSRLILINTLKYFTLFIYPRLIYDVKNLFMRKNHLLIYTAIALLILSVLIIILTNRTLSYQE